MKIAGALATGTHRCKTGNLPNDIKGFTEGFMTKFSMPATARMPPALQSRPAIILNMNKTLSPHQI